MKLKGVLIEGYGRLSKTTMDFAPGLQIIAGPNERGKSTLRAFISDMLYGQKRSPRQRVYDDANELREPWEAGGEYGGKLIYTLDNGEEFEISRTFSRKSEEVQVYSRTHGEDRTASFPRLKNGEINFAMDHLGLSKEVFNSVATIGHFSLDDLGDADAMKQIREKLLSLADSGDEYHSAEAALKRLEERVQAIGQSNARTRPLPSARLRLEELGHESRAARELLEMLGVEEQERQALREDLSELRNRKAALEQALKALDAHDRASRLEESENLAKRIDAATQQCFALSKYRDFPLDDAPEVQRLEALTKTGEQELERIARDLEEFTRQLEEERSQSDREDDEVMEPVPEQEEMRLNDLNATAHLLQQRIEETDTQARDADRRLETCLQEITALPDFSRMASDPVEWFTQLASSFDVARRSRDEECAQRDRLRGEVAQREAAIEEDQKVFDGIDDFVDEARDYDVRKRHLEEQRGQKQSYLTSLQGTREEIADNTGFLVMSAVCVVFLGMLLYWYDQSAMKGTLYAAATILMAIAYFLGSYTYSRTRTAQLDRNIEKTRLELNALEVASDGQEHPMEALIEAAGCANVRELEARFDEYRLARSELDARLDALTLQEEKAREAEERIPLLLLRFQQTFAQAGVDISDESDVSSAAGRAISRYQEYREAKRRASECRTFCERYRSELKRLEQVYQEAIAERGQLEDVLYDFMEKHGFSGARGTGCVQTAVRAYRERISQFRERHGRADLIVQRQLQLQHKQDNEKRGVEKHRKALRKVLERAGSASAEDWHAARGKALEYQEIWAKRTTLEEQLNALLRGQDLNRLRAQVAEAGLPAEISGEDREQLEGQLDACIHRMELLQEQEHALHVELAEKSRSMRCLNEIEEEQAAVRKMVEELELELDASSYAMALIEDIAGNKHAQLAPGLAQKAGHYLALITGGAYSEVLIGQDLTISVRIPETSTLSKSPEKSLSKGTVDQIYLALRLALVQGISSSGETIPMLLDDPFANYDDERLESTLRLMQSIAEENQILLFTCREDVVSAAEGINAHIIRL